MKIILTFISALLRHTMSVHVQPESLFTLSRNMQHLCFDDKTDQITGGETLATMSCTQPDRPAPQSTMINENTVPREALPSLDDLPSLSDDNIGDMLNLLRTLLHACEEHYKDPIRRLNEQRHQELLPDWGQDLPMSPITGWDDDF